MAGLVERGMHPARSRVHIVKILPPGVYCLSAAAKTGTLTLDAGTAGASAVWIFLVAGALTGTNFNVIMLNGGDPCNVS